MHGVWKFNHISPSHPSHPVDTLCALPSMAVGWCLHRRLRKKFLGLALGTQLEASQCHWAPSRCICAPARSSTRLSREGISGERYDGMGAKGSEHGHRWKGSAKVSSMARSAISGKKVDLSVLSPRRDGSEGRPLPFSCTSTISCTLRESKLLPPFTRGQPSAGRRSIYQCRALDGTVAKVGHCVSRPQAPLVVP